MGRRSTTDRVGEEAVGRCDLPAAGERARKGDLLDPFERQWVMHFNMQGLASLEGWRFAVEE